MSDYLDPNNEELLKDFFIEAESQVDALEQNILVLENDPGERDAIDEIFRAAHTLKGAAATVQMTNLAEFTHLVEDVLDAIRSSEISADEHAVDVLLNSIDVIKEMLETKREGGEFDADISDLKDQLSGLLSNAGPAPKRRPNRRALKPVRPAGNPAGFFRNTMCSSSMMPPDPANKCTRSRSNSTKIIR
jgi:two-component system chemotaxis sensor kinase CheA